MIVPRNFLQQGTVYSQEVIIDLDGPEVNVIYLLAHARYLASDLDLQFEDIKKEMLSGSYPNAVKTFDRYFGDYVILIEPIAGL